MIRGLHTPPRACPTPTPQCTPQCTRPPVRGTFQERCPINHSPSQRRPTPVTPVTPHIPVTPVESSQLGVKTFEGHRSFKRRLQFLCKSNTAKAIQHTGERHGGERHGGERQGRETGERHEGETRGERDRGRDRGERPWRE